MTVEISSQDSSEVTVSPSSITFNSLNSNNNWNTDQTITLTGQDDTLIDGEVEFSIILSLPIQSNNPAVHLYSEVTQTLTGKNIDNEVAGVTLSKTSGLSTAETGTGGSNADSFTVKLTGNQEVTLFLL